MRSASHGAAVIVAMFAGAFMSAALDGLSLHRRSPRPARETGSTHPTRRRSAYDGLAGEPPQSLDAAVR